MAQHVLAGGLGWLTDKLIISRILPPLVVVLFLLGWVMMSAALWRMAKASGLSHGWTACLPVGQARMLGRLSDACVAASGGPLPAEPEQSAAPAAPALPKAEAPSGTGTGEKLFDEWESVLDVLQRKKPMLFALLTGSRAFLSGGRVLIDAPNETFITFMQKNSDMREDIKNAIAEVCGQRFGIGPYKKAETKPETDPLAELEKRAKEAGIELL